MDFDTGTTTAVTADVAIPSTPPAETAVVMGAPAAVLKPDTITVYAESITANAWNDMDPIVSFDVVFTVSIRNNNGEDQYAGCTTKTYKVVKRIGVDKAKIACDALGSVPVSIVESNDALDKKKAAEKLNEHLAQMRQIAGVNAPKK